MERACRRRILDLSVCVDFLVSVHPSVFKKNDWESTGITKAKVPGDDGNE